MLDLNARWALVTGASRGIGHEISIALAKQGCNLILHSRKLEHTEKLAQTLRAAGTDVQQICGDLGVAAEFDEMLAKLPSLPDVDILYNNAAVMHSFVGDVWEITAESLRQSFEINLVSQVRLCNAIIPGMIERGFGRIINLVSDIDRIPNLAPYAVTKSALEKYTHDIVPALEASGVAMNALNPGWLRTDLGSDEAPNPVEIVIPGALVPALLDSDVCGTRFEAQDFRDMTIEAAVSKAIADRRDVTERA